MRFSRNRNSAFYSHDSSDPVSGITGPLKKQKDISDIFEEIINIIQELD